MHPETFCRVRRKVSSHTFAANADKLFKIINFTIISKVVCYFAVLLRTNRCSGCAVAVNLVAIANRTSCVHKSKTFETGVVGQQNISLTSVVEYRYLLLDKKA